MHAHTDTHIHAHTRAHIHTHTHTHTHTHRHTHFSSPPSPLFLLDFVPAVLRKMSLTFKRECSRPCQQGLVPVIQSWSARTDSQSYTLHHALQVCSCLTFPRHLRQKVPLGSDKVIIWTSLKWPVRKIKDMTVLHCEGRDWSCATLLYDHLMVKVYAIPGEMLCKNAHPHGQHFAPESDIVDKTTAPSIL